MLVLPSDSGYNSPCDGIAPSSLQFASEKLLKPDVNSEVRRKLRFGTHTFWNSGSYFTLPKPNDRLREIARRLVRMCDSFDKEFAEVAEGAKTESVPDEASIIKFMDDYMRTIIIKEGTITAGFPFNENVSKLKDNFNIAFRRLQALLRTLRGDAKKLQIYNTTIEDYTREGIIEECTSQPTGHIEEKGTPIGKELSKSPYVDNVLLEGDNPQELIQKYNSLKQVFSSIGMNLRDYLSDSAAVNAQIKDVDRAKNRELKVLGIKWKADDDTLVMECADKEQVKITKRSVLSQINGFCFDPLGLLTPLMIPAKIFLQDIHKLKLG
ncbi:unnamed protein product [Cylicocyclus nassatus]|uniref:Uncharacterized protein n=1 Tax=Cylicocyclus nassatus TaxID=53992 RepID=A0AA36DN86_CYLNA|nr:unnamed protein product [Cylicocyclus nassatus]